MKVCETVIITDSSRTNISVGTPSRLVDLLKEDAISTRNLQRLVIDASYIDQKKRGVLDIQEVFLPLLDLLLKTGLKERLAEGKTKILVY
jgi:protein CMS1